MAIHYATLEIKEADSIHTITLNRPERRNALNPQMIAELTHAFGEASTCACGVVVLTGAGTAFCSGMDLENLKSLTHQRPGGSAGGRRSDHVDDAPALRAE